MHTPAQSVHHGGAARLLIVCPSWVGDCVMATPVFRAVRAAWPQATITALLRPGLDDLLAGSAWFDQVIAMPNRGWLGPWRVAAALRTSRPQVALLLPNSFRSALTARLARVPRRIGTARDGRAWLLTEAVPSLPRGAPLAAVETYALLGERLCDGPIVDRRLELAVTPDQQAAADRLLRDVRQPFLLLNPGANRADKRWPVERFATAADALAARHGLEIVATGSPGERPLMQRLRAAAKTPIVDLASAGVDLGSLKGVIRRCALLLTNDTGPRHIAAALGRPTVALFGPTDHRWTTLACATEHVLVAAPFLPADQVADQHPRECSINRIEVADVIAAANRLLPRGAAAKVPT
jgi:heptosyltransferase II